ncbi:MAG TPA: 6-phosphogluconolactonase [Polyangiaceae bacterium LLY-WYZ-14_1]|nr:6-phosphogluconolactonase [Polyangiaceae bacterium LLY-WYZ-14_1]
MTTSLDPSRWTLFVADDPDERRAAFRARFEEVAKDAAAARGRFVVALTGGSTVPQYYPALVDADVDWSTVHVLFGDERAVGPDHPDSNARACREALLDHVTIPAAQVHRMEGELADPEQAASRYAEVLRRVAGAPPVIDLLHLGLGPDGHVASLFPGHPGPGETERTVLSVADSPKPPPRRVTLSLPVLTAARETWLFAHGENKRAAVARAATEPTSELPVARVLQRAPRVLVFIDTSNAQVFPVDTPRATPDRDRL